MTARTELAPVAAARQWKEDEQIAVLEGFFDSLPEGDVPARLRAYLGNAAAWRQQLPTRNPYFDGCLID